MTLDEMIQQVADFSNDTVVKDGGVYTGEDLIKVNRIVSALNYAYKKICREKYKLEYKESIADNKDISTLTKNLYSIKEIIYNSESIPYEIKNNTIVFDLLENADLYYYYIPLELVNLTDTPALPSNVDHKGLCFYATFSYLMTNGQDYGEFLNLWNDFFESIFQNRKINRKVKGVW